MRSGTRGVQGGSVMSVDCFTGEGLEGETFVRTGSSIDRAGELLTDVGL